MQPCAARPPLVRPLPPLSAPVTIGTVPCEVEAQGGAVLKACRTALVLVTDALQTQAVAAEAERMPFIRRGAASSVQTAALQLRATMAQAERRGAAVASAQRTLDAALQRVQPLLPPEEEDEDE